MKIKLRKLHEKATVPERGTEFSGGWDVTATTIIQEAEDFVICKLGFALEIPEGYKLTLVPRSSLTKTHWIVQNSPGLGDADYRGEYQYRFRAIPIGADVERNMFGTDHKVKLIYPEFPFKENERIGQVYIEEVLPIEFEVVEDLSDTVRGEGGFGSTGK